MKVILRAISVAISRSKPIVSSSAKGVLRLRSTCVALGGALEISSPMPSFGTPEAFEAVRVENVGTGNRVRPLLHDDAVEEQLVVEPAPVHERLGPAERPGEP